MEKMKKLVGQGPADENTIPVQPPVYEIRIEGRLDGEHWDTWFEGMEITIDGRHTVLRGPVTDQAALYGLLSRLRDLALELHSVRVLDAYGRGGAWLYRDRNLTRPRINWVLILVYTLLTGGLSAITVFLAVEAGLNVALALVLLFCSLGAMGMAFFFADGGKGWRWASGLGWLGAFVSLIVYMAVAGWLHPAIVAALACFLLGGGVLVLFFRNQRTEPKTIQLPPEWQPLGGQLSSDDVKMNDAR